MDAKTNPAAHSMQEKLKNSKTIRDARREMGKFSLDSTKITLSVRRGTLSLFGKFAPLSGKEAIFEDERKALLKALQNLPQIHAVVCQ
jgi:hypothetical protein